MAKKSISGYTGTPEWFAWYNMIARCTDPEHDWFRHYGGRGIKVCQRWSTFAQFSTDMGPRPSRRHSLDRIDVNGNYEPGNCRWATVEEQANNTTRTVLVTYKGETKTVAQWANEIGIRRGLLWLRIFDMGWPLEKAMTAEVKKGRTFVMNGQSKTIAAWAKSFGLSRSLVKGRIANGWSIEEAVSIPSRVKMDSNVLPSPN
jgi:hypothetical protein